MAYKRSLFRIAILASCAVSSSVLAWIPPHPDSKIEWESVHDMRRRLNLEKFDYKPSKFIGAEMCRFLTEEECEETDKSMQEHIRAHKNLQKLTRQNPTMGSINVLVLMVRFSDHTSRELASKADVENFWRTIVPEWLDANSQGRYDIKATVIDWITTDNTEGYYSFGKRGIVPEAQKMAWPALDNLDNRAGWDWSNYDLDGDGRLDSLVVMHSGYGAETTETDCFGAEFNNRIWAHAGSASRKNTWRNKDNTLRVGGYTMASALDGNCGVVPAKMGLTVHEYMHTLGLVDLYDGVDPIKYSGIGAFDIMAYPYGQAGNANMPGHLSVYSKLLCDWVQPKEITSNGDYDLKASEISDEAYRITLADYGLSTEYLLIEKRQPLEFDMDLWSEGLVIYHIEDDADLQKNRGFPGQPGWPGNGNHYEVALLPKDGLYDLEQGNNNGDAGDFWVPGDRLGPGDGGKNYPNTDTYAFGEVEETGVWLEVLSQSGTDSRFRVGGLDDTATQPPTKAPTRQPTLAPSKIFTTVAPTITGATSPPTTAPSPIPPTTAPSPIPFGEHVELTKNPSYLASFGNFGSISTRRPTPIPYFANYNNRPTPAPVGYLNTFGGTPTNYFNSYGAVDARPTSFDSFGTVDSRPTKPYLDNFGSASEVKLSPPKAEEITIIPGHVFLSSAFHRNSYDNTDSEQSSATSECWCVTKLLFLSSLSSLVMLVF